MDAAAPRPAWPTWVSGETECAAVRIRALKLTQLMAIPREQAVACHDFVRSLELQFRAGTARHVAQVLSSEAGTALEKSDLLIALLRCCSIPARLRIYSVRPHAFRGLAEERATVLHPVVEARLGSRWLSVDTHHMDVALALAARVKLLNERLQYGYGVHLGGASNWDGTKDAFAFMGGGDPAMAPLRDCGVFRDVADLKDIAAEFKRLGSRTLVFAGMRASSRASKLRSALARVSP